ncbi:MAG: uroporphyrinogen decarboxylase family protein [Oceanipulchritudo sp.]
MVSSVDGTNFSRFLTVLEGAIPDRLPLLHVWGHREGYHAGHLSAWANERRLPVRAQTTFLKYQRAHGHALGLGVEGWFSKLPKGEGEAAGGVHRYLQHGIEIGCDLRPFEELGDMDALAEETIRMKTLNQAHGLGTRGFVTNSFHALSGALGLEDFCYALYDDRDWLEAAMDQAERYNRRGLEVMIRNGIDMVTIDGDLAYKTGTMISPQLLREIWFPRTRACVELLKDAGVAVMYHTDGKVDAVLPMLIEMGVDCFHGCEKAANDLADLKARFGRDITLIGNFDHAEMTFGTPDEIVAKTREMLAIGMPGGRYIADINTSVPSEAPVANYAAFIDTIRSEGVYA